MTDSDQAPLGLESPRVPGPSGLEFPRVFSTAGVDPAAALDWEARPAVIEKTGDDGARREVFRQDGVEVPATWSQQATNVVASKFFHGDPAVPGPPAGGGREHSVRQLVGRVAGQVAEWGRGDRVFRPGPDPVGESARAFADELAALCLGQYGSFNSPVWFNLGLHRSYGLRSDTTNWRWNPEVARLDDQRRPWGGVRPAEDGYEYPQISACFIQSVADDMDSIMRLAYSEAMLFKYGSGTGTDLSPLRSSKEKLSGGGVPSGPLSFLMVYDSIAKVVKSGGKTRRAAKMNTLKARHPDIREFVAAKPHEERKAKVLAANGYGGGGIDTEASRTVAFQNVNLSVRAGDDFMQAVEEGNGWTTYAVTTGDPVATFPARDLMGEIADAAWECGCPGMQFDDTINAWHTCPNSGRINSTNPCSEYAFLDDSACNLASLNLMKFRRADGTFDADRFRAAVRVFVTAQEILVDHASYPTEAIALNSHRFRPLGLGYANLGALLMVQGHPYDSDEGRALAGAITSLMTAQAYLTSAELAAHLGPFDGFADNREPMLAVIELHAEAAWKLAFTCEHTAAGPLAALAERVWREALAAGREHGFRHAQVTLLAPTGTIAFMMDCDTTGIEPFPGLVTHKQLAGGGSMALTYRSIREALGRHCGLAGEDLTAAMAWIEEHGDLEGFDGAVGGGYLDSHPDGARRRAIFDTAFPARPGGRSIHWRGHVRMMAAVQPFLSGAISKTVNLPGDAAPADFREAYAEAWRLGVKAVAMYRDGSKASQPLSVQAPKAEGNGVATGHAASAAAARLDGPADAVGPPRAAAPASPRRERMPTDRRSLTHKFDVAGHEGYLTVGFYDDGRPGELFIRMAKDGSTVGGTMDVVATLASMCLQYGVPLEVLCAKFAHVRFEPSGFTRDPAVGMASSLADYVFRWMGVHFVAGGAARWGRLPEQAAAGPAPEKAPLGRSVLREAYANWAAKPALFAAASPATSGRESPPVADGPACPGCGHLMTRSGACYACRNCGENTGCG
jgi:ribonucleoside-diphosphate reductase alpha chain